MTPSKQDAATSNDDNALLDTARYWEDRLRAHYDLAGVGYLSLGRAYNEWLYRVRAIVFRRVVAGLGLDASAARILDVGSGTGFYVERWLAHGAADVTGVDITAVAVERLAARHPGCRFVQGDIGGPLDALPLEAGRFDAATAMDVLFHIVDDEAYARALANLAALLKPGGWLIWSDAFRHGPTLRVAHQASRTRAEIVAALDAAGLEIVRRVPMFVWMNYPVDARSTWWPAVWQRAARLVRRRNAIGWLAGALLFPIEVVLTRVVAESPTTEVLVCRRRGMDCPQP
ncbi:MAG: class I SAM-dependent methyltransferase [Ardenticatenales bacterium]